MNKNSKSDYRSDRDSESSKFDNVEFADEINADMDKKSDRRSDKNSNRRSDENSEHN